MVRCLLCDKKFKTERGLSVHLARTHDIHGLHGRLSLRAIRKFFPLLRKRQWAKAEKILKLAVKNIEEDQWIKGYVHALNGMVAALKVSYSPPKPYIVKLNNFGSKKLQEVKDMFTDLYNAMDNKNTFEAAYFQAWGDFTHYVLHSQD